MIPAKQEPSARHTSSQPVLELMSRDSLKEICTAPGPFVTVFLPACHPGAADLSRAERMKTILRAAAHELERRRCQGPIEQLLKPLEKLVENSETLAGGCDSVMFVSPGILRHLRLLAPTPERLIVASHPHITPVLAQLMPERLFYILAITKKLLRLGRWQDGQCTEVPLPAGVPKSFEEALDFDQPDHDLQNRSSAGTGAAQVGPTRFGTGSVRDRVHERLHDYLQRVDRELTGSLDGAPLVLVGVEQELAAYRSVSLYSRVLVAKPTSPEHLTWDELRERGQATILETQQGEAERVLGELRETAHRDRVITGIREVLEAAREGRVHKLLLESAAEHEGLLGPFFPMDSEHIEGEQDLINAAAVETIRRRGEVYTLDRGQSHGYPIAALLRYSA